MTTKTIAAYLEDERKKGRDTQLRVEQEYPSGKHTLNGRRETSLEIVRPVSASGSKLWV